jgi:capsular polysaccharide transport system permease protein
MGRVQLSDRPATGSVASPPPAGHLPSGPRMETIQLVPVEPAHGLLDMNLAVAPEAASAAARRPWSFKARLFTWLVIVPTFAAAVYFFLFAAHRYVSEANFIVRSAVYQGGSTVPQMGLSASHAGGDLADAVNTYVLSRDMVGELERQDGLRDVLSRGGWDVVYRFPVFWRRDNKEQLYRHYLRMADAEVDKTNGINTITVRAFRPEDAQRLAEAMLQHAEELINRLNARMIRDAETYAQSVVDHARDHVVEVALHLAAFRNSIGSVDPSRESAAALDQIAQMATDIAETQAMLQQQIALSPSSPALPALRERIRTVKEQMEKEKLKIVGTDRSLATKLSDFEKLTLDRELAAREMDSALASLTTARQDVQRQHLYLQRIAEPNLADEARYPLRLFGVTLAFAACFALFIVVNAICNGIREHLP